LVFTKYGRESIDTNVYRKTQYDDAQRATSLEKIRRSFSPILIVKLHIFFFFFFFFFSYFIFFFLSEVKGPVMDKVKRFKVT